MKVVLASITLDERGYCASATLKKAALKAMHTMKISLGYLDFKEYKPSDLVHTTLETLNILDHEIEAYPITRQMLEEQLVIALDEKTRNRIQKEFGKLIPLYYEVSHNVTKELEELDDVEYVHDHLISVIHHLEDSSTKILERIEHFY